jgi:hypothetical protein
MRVARARSWSAADGRAVASTASPTDDDASKLVDVFERNSVTFVSVTQSFCTMTSMGRLTLNILLSFAQFERELAGDRIRDKFAASRRKGIFMAATRRSAMMSGTASCGKPGRGRADPPDLPALPRPRLRAAADPGAQRPGSAHQVLDHAGTFREGRPFDKGTLYKILRNRTYLGEAVHKGQSYPGEHVPIVDRATWDQLHGVLASNARRRANEARADRSANGFPNGMCLSADGRRLYVVESSPPLISTLEIRDDGSAGERTVVVELPRQVPDGVALDQNGELYIAMYNPNIIYQYKANGELVTLYDDWEQLKLVAPTNIAFGGVDLSTLIIASLCGWFIHTARMAVPGLPLRYPKL